ncbi:hypothetical protein D8I35_05310 [Corticibacter populi]|uniref:Uncharacterized protein n=1 Tax=Corticibacter populi TaxID=1550736 RepID=A0A3M6QZN8_9BURK|nr:hypothetical protein D8I35_05310 [Corticibacter populi]
MPDLLCRGTRSCHAFSSRASQRGSFCPHLTQARSSHQPSRRNTACAHRAKRLPDSFENDARVLDCSLRFTNEPFGFVELSMRLARLVGLDVLVDELFRFLETQACLVFQELAGAPAGGNVGQAHDQFGDADCGIERRSSYVAGKAGDAAAICFDPHL